MWYFKQQFVQDIEWKCCVLLLLSLPVLKLKQLVKKCTYLTNLGPLGFS